MSSTNAKVLACCGAIALLWLLLYCVGRRINIKIFEGSGTPSTFRFASYYQDEMVLQAAPYRAILWGYGTVGAQVEITVNIYTIYHTTVSDVIDGQGIWSVTLEPEAPGTRAVISASQMHAGTLKTSWIEDAVFGDVWICGGQSNMVFPIGHMFNASEELENVGKYPDVRIFTASQEQSSVPLHDLKGITQKWAKPTATNAQYFSAVCWLFGRNLHDTLQVPIGLISTNWGGTAIELWSSPRALKSCGLQKRSSSFYEEFYEDRQVIAMPSSVLWNAMIYPFLNMTIKGAIWYQGEANAEHNINLYNCTFPAMIEDWRRSWYDATNRQTEEVFPFGFVQLATETIPSENGRFPLVRWHQTADVGYVPNTAMPGTFMAVAMDLPDPSSPYGSIHPRDKRDVGRRLSIAALDYGYYSKVDIGGPFPLFIVKNGSDLMIIYRYPNVKVMEDAATNFEICCSGSRCDVSDLTPEGFSEWLPVEVSSHTSSEIQITAGACPSGAKRVRYAWSTVPCKFKDCQVYSLMDFPAPPFVMDVTSDNH